jgi:hypothetical protein
LCTGCVRRGRCRTDLVHKVTDRDDGWQPGGRAGRPEISGSPACCVGDRRSGALVGIGALSGGQGRRACRGRAVRFRRACLCAGRSRSSDLGQVVVG